VGENGWPYVQFRGGLRGFLKVIDETTPGYADFRGNGQYIGAGKTAGKQQGGTFSHGLPCAVETANLGRDKHRGSKR
jgi:predicted pyridoxine 5'-phosphate oxidase superfamily flavin-nucleotide-binding protein